MVAFHIGKRALAGHLFHLSYKVIVGKNIKTIGKSAFEGCQNLKKITVKTAKLTKKTIGKNSFKGIAAKVVFKRPKAVKKNYTKWLKSPGGAKNAQIK